MAKTTGKKQAPAFGSLDPDNMIQGGLPTDFRGVVTHATYCEFDYEGAADEPTLAARLTIQSDDFEEPVVQHWSAGNLNAWVPADEDGERQAEGPYPLRVGKRPEMNNNTNFAHLMKSILESGEAAKGKPFTRKNLTSSIECLVGLDAQWDRVPQQKRSGMVDAEEGEGGEKKSNRRDVLVVSEVFGYDPDAAEAKPAKKVAKKPAKPVVEEEEEEPETEVEEVETEEEESTVSPLDAKIDAAVKKAITKAGGSIKKGKLAPAMLAAFAADPKVKAKAVPRVTEEEFLSDDARSWDFDEDTGVLTLKDED